MSFKTADLDFAAGREAAGKGDHQKAAFHLEAAAAEYNRLATGLLLGRIRILEGDDDTQNAPPVTE